MNREDIIRMAREAGIANSWDLNWQDKIIERFAKLVAQHVHKSMNDEALELPEPRLTGKFSITAGQFKCTGCTGTWADREDAKHHSCKDYQ